MRRFRTVTVAAALIGVATVASGCGPTYYRVNDPTTNRTYYTTKLEKKSGGGVEIRDAGTGKTVTLQNSEVAKVTKEEFETGKVRTAP